MRQNNDEGVNVQDAVNKIYVFLFFVVYLSPAGVCERKGGRKLWSGKEQRKKKRGMWGQREDRRDGKQEEEEEEKEVMCVFPGHGALEKEVIRPLTTASHHKFCGRGDEGRELSHYAFLAREV